jgi:hypothetical protein
MHSSFWSNAPKAFIKKKTPIETTIAESKTPQAISHRIRELI